MTSRPGSSPAPRPVAQTAVPLRWLAGLARERAARSAPPPVLTAPGAIVPLAPAQRTWLRGELDARPLRRVVMWTARLTGPVDCQALAAALTNVARHHPLLRATVRTAGDGPAACIGKVPGDVRILEPEGRTTRAREEHGRRLLRERRADVRLRAGPIYVATVVPVSDNLCLLGIAVHHVVCDGRSLRIILDEVAADYASLASGGPARPASAGPAMTLGPPQGSLDFWAAKLDGAPSIDFPQDIPAQPGRLLPLRLVLDQQSTQAVRAAAAACRATLPAVLLAGLALGLRGYTAGPDVVIGLTTDTRTAAQIGQVGCYAAVLPLRVRWDEKPGMTFADVIDQVKGELLAALMHRDVPLSSIVKRLRAGSGAAGAQAAASTWRQAPLFEVVFSYLEPGSEEFRLPRVDCEVVESEGGVVNSRLVVTAQEDDGQIEIVLESRPSSLSAQTVSDFAARLSSLVTAAAAAPHAPWPPWASHDREMKQPAAPARTETYGVL
jgi:hypothetical protein